MLGLEADGLIYVYKLDETAEVVAEYEGLGVHDLVIACSKLHPHPKTAEKLGIRDGHIIVDADAWHNMVKALLDVAPWAATRIFK